MLLSLIKNYAAIIVFIIIWDYLNKVWIFP